MDHNIYNLIFQLTVLPLTICVLVCVAVIGTLLLPIILPLHFLFSKDEPEY